MPANVSIASHISVDTVAAARAIVVRILLLGPAEGIN